MRDDLSIDEVLMRGVDKIYPSREGLAKLMAAKRIRLYQGFDPSMPALHLGNMVGLMKLRQFQTLGHEVIFLVGDFTGMIGDPTDKFAVRPKLTKKQILKNCKNWKNQAAKILNFDGKNPALLKFNSEWLEKLKSTDFFNLASNLTFQQVIERDMFQKRLKAGKDIYLNEFLYPFMQGYDSIAMQVDLEIGGADQIFNMLMGRKLMRNILKKEKYVLATKLLVDSQGEKVGKTTGNALFLDSTPNDFFAGVMSFPDETIELGFELLTEVSLPGLKEKIQKDPMGEKKRLAYEVVKMLWGENQAGQAEQNFEKTFQDRKPEYINSVTIQKNLTYTVSKVVGSTSKAKRLIGEGAVDVNGKTVIDPNTRLKSGDTIKIGKKIFIKVK